MIETTPDTSGSSKRPIAGSLVAGILLGAACAAPPPTHSPGRFAPTAIVLHSTSGLDRSRALTEMSRRGMGVHVLVDTDGTPHQVAGFDRPVRAARGIDDVAIHVSVVGTHGAELLENRVQLAEAARVVDAVAARFSIPKTNADVASRRGIFSHMQVKYRFGGLRLDEPKDRMEPGEVFMEALLRRIGGAFVEEKDWVDRAGEGWLFVWERTDLGRRGDLTRGRGLTPAPTPPRRPLEASEERRMRYVDRGTMSEVRGIVLHFTATGTYEAAVQAFERRRLGPSIIVDVDGRAWRVVDRLEDKVAAAAGTNDHCIQIEIVGEDEKALLANEAQSRKVVEVVAELCAAYSIPKNNRDIESLRGVFSHGQAKKRWGRSAWLWGSDFDPGEAYMKRILEGARGTYVEEKDWTGRKSDAWVIQFEDWIP